MNACMYAGLFVWTYLLSNSFIHVVDNNNDDDDDDNGNSNTK